MTAVKHSEFCKQRGFSLIEILVAVGIMGFVTLTMASMFSNQQLEMKALQEKFDSRGLQSTLLTVMQNPSTCQANLATWAAVTDISSAVGATKSVNNIPITELHSGNTAISPIIAKVGDPLPGRNPGQMIVSAIQIQDIFSTGNLNEYQGRLTVTFAAASMVRPLRDIWVDQIFTITPPATAAVISGCGSSGSLNWVAYATGPAGIPPNRRTSGEIYTNTTGHAIQVVTTVDLNSTLTVKVNGVTILGYGNVNAPMSPSFTVPAGATYQIIAPGAVGPNGIGYWSEYR